MALKKDFLKYINSTMNVHDDLKKNQKIVTGYFLETLKNIIEKNRNNLTNMQKGINELSGYEENFKSYITPGPYQRTTILYAYKDEFNQFFKHYKDLFSDKRFKDLTLTVLKQRIEITKPNKEKVIDFDRKLKTIPFIENLFST
jgi:hypothetical protein